MKREMSLKQVRREIRKSKEMLEDVNTYRTKKNLSLEIRLFALKSLEKELEERAREISQRVVI